MTAVSRYVARRLVQLAITVFFVLFLNFLIINLAPGDPATLMAGEYATKEYIEAIRAKWGLDKPILERFALYMWNLMHGDLGFSFRYLEPVSKLILERITATLLLTLTSAVLAFIMGLLLATYSVRRVGSTLDTSLSLLTLLLYSFPVFFLGIVLILIFGVQFKILPIAGMTSVREEYTGLEYYLDILKHAILPVLSLALVQLPVYYKVTRSSILEELGRDYVTTLRAMGLREGLIFRKHILRNALLPPVTIFGIHLGFILAGAALVEIVFGWPGMGRLLLDAVFTRDYPLIMGIYLIIAVGVSLANFAVDLLYLVLDPRVKYR